jgi:hypothetical protein
MADNQTQSSDPPSDSSPDDQQSSSDDPMEQSFSGNQTQQPSNAEVANAYQVLANQYQGFVDNPVALTPGGTILLQEIRNMRAEMKRGFKRVDKRFGQIEKRGRAE